MTVLAGFTEDNSRLLLEAVAAGVSMANGNRWFLTDASKDPHPADQPGREPERDRGLLRHGARVRRGPSDPTYKLFADRFSTAYKAGPGAVLLHRARV